METSLFYEYVVLMIRFQNCTLQYPQVRIDLMCTSPSKIIQIKLDRGGAAWRNG